MVQYQSHKCWDVKPHSPPKKKQRKQRHFLEALRIHQKMVICQSFWRHGHGWQFKALAVIFGRIFKKFPRTICRKFSRKHFHTPLKMNMEPNNWWFVGVSPWNQGIFSGSMLVFGGVNSFLSSFSSSWLKGAALR